MKAAKAVPLLKETYQQWSAHKSPTLAAALAYYTIFSLAPLLLILIAIAGLIFGADAAHGQITGQLQHLIGAKAASQIDAMVKAAGSHKSGTIATVIGVVMLILGASGLVLQLQDALNTIWDVDPERKGGFLVMIRERILSFSMILGIGFLLLVSLVISSVLSALNTYTASLVPALAFVLQVCNVIFDLAILTLFFAMIFKFLPEAEVRWKDVWVGGAMTAVLFVIGQFALTVYFGKMNVGSPYGDAGSIIIVLLWVYYSAQLLLFGAEFTRVWSGGHLGSRGGRALKGTLKTNNTSSRKPVV
ncbi:MAG: YihY/virulence factor BrkB family protein [Candidatus Baltobacteraceae bacterium]